MIKVEFTLHLTKTEKVSPPAHKPGFPLTSFVCNLEFDQTNLMRNLLALLLLAPYTLLAQVPDYIPTDGLVAYWPLDGNGLDQSGSGHHLTETNIQPGQDRHGEAESTVVFNGVNSHLTLDAFNLNQSGSFSVGFWAQMDPGAFTEPQCLFYEGIDGEFHFANADPGVDFTQFHWAAKANSSAWYGPAAGPLSSGEWNHFVGTYDQGSLDLFVNGISVATQQAACCSPAPTDQLVLGARRVTSFVEHPFSGALDDFALWNRALTSEEIGELYSESTEAEPSTENLALEFSGISDYLGPNAGILEIPFADALDRTGSEPFTIASDVLFDADAIPYALFHTGQDGDPENSIRFNISTSELEFMWENTGANYKLECALPATSMGTLDTEVWHNIAASWDGVTLTLFVNGIEVASEAPGNGGPGETEDRPFYWGSHLGGNELDGQLDNTQFWTIGLTQQDIQSHLDCPPTGSEPGLEAFWTFNGPDSDIILDITGNGHHGNAQGVQKVPSTRPACSEYNDGEGLIELLIVGAHGEETATREALEAYQLDSTLTDRNLSITEVDFQDSISPCGQWDALLQNKDAVLFLGTANLDNCSWEDIIPALDSFMRAGGEVYLQAENSYGMVTRFDGNGSNWPADWSDHLTEAEAAQWFGTAFTAEQPWCCGMGSINLNCINNTDVLGIEHDCNPLFFGAYESPESCITHFQEPWLYEVADGDLDSENFFSVFHFGGDHNSSNPANVLTGNQMVFGLHFGEGNLVVFGDNRPGFAGGETQFLLGNLIHGLSHPESLSNLIAPDSGCAGTSATIGCTNPTACNYNPTATVDDGSCQLPPAIGWSTDTSICAVPFVLDAGPGFDVYLWNTGDTAQTITEFQEGQYSVEVTETGTGDSHSLQFDGVDDYVDIPDIDITGSGPFTLCASARLLGETGTDFYNILSSGENDSGLLQWGINDNDLRMAFYHADYYPVESNVSIERFEWYHTAVVYDGTDLILYLNAEEVQRQSVTLNLTQSVRFIGQWQVDSDIIAAREPWHGQLDHVGIWNTALSQDQIAEQMSCPSSPEPDGLMAFWNFEADSGNVVSDNGNVVSIGTVVGANYSSQVTENLCPECSATDSIHVTVDFDCLYCGEGTEWDEDTQQCIAVGSGATPSCGEGTVWDPVAQECIVAIPTDTDFDGCVTAGDILNLLANFGTCPPIPEWPEDGDSNWSCGDSLAHQGHDYSTVQIGGQCWFAENLRATESADGESLEAGTPSTWPGYQNGTGAWAYPNNEPLEEVVFGLLYNWFATVQGDGICPSGWHLPSDEEWKDMETHLGISAADLDSFGWHGATQGTELKAVAEWDGVDMHGFAAFPSGGMHADQGHAGSFGSEVWFWTSSTLPTESGKAIFRSLSSGESRIQRHHTFKNHGASIRCLKD